MKRAFFLLGLAMAWSLGFAQTVEVESDTYSFSIGTPILDKLDKQAIPLSDVDMNIPQTKVLSDKTFVVIIANEKYQHEQSVPFAVHDGEIFKQYCIQTLGIPEKNIRFLANATLNNMKHDISWLKNALSVFKGEGKGIVYYSGHGIPDESSHNAFLMPVDGYSTDPESGFSLDKLDSDLGSVKAETVTYFIDACFSGADRGGKMMAQNRGVAIKSRAGVLKGNSVAFSAAQGDETAYVYQEKSHGMFTYFLLKKLQETNGNVSYGNLADYVYDNVRKMSMIENSKMQSPSATASSALADSWRKLKIN